MQKIRTIDGNTYTVKSVITNNGCLEITFGDDITAEDVQSIFRDKANLNEITLLTMDEGYAGTVYGYVCYSGLFMQEDTKRVVLTKETDKDSIRINKAEAEALTAKTKASQAESALQAALAEVSKLQAELTATQLAVIELYEMEG